MTKSKNNQECEERNKEIKRPESQEFKRGVKSTDSMQGDITKRTDATQLESPLLKRDLIGLSP